MIVASFFFAFWVNGNIYDGINLLENGLVLIGLIDEVCEPLSYFGFVFVFEMVEEALSNAVFVKVHKCLAVSVGGFSIQYFFNPSVCGVWWELFDVVEAFQAQKFFGCEEVCFAMDA